MTVTEDDIVYAYGKMRKEIQEWIDARHSPPTYKLSALLARYPAGVGDAEPEDEDEP